MKKQLLITFLAVALSTSVVACGSDETATESQEESVVSDETEQSDAEIVVGNLLELPAFTAEKNTSAMVDQIGFTAKDYADSLTDDEANEIISIIMETNPQFYDGADEMELFMWYGYLLDYKYDDSDTRSQLGTDLCQAIKYVYRGAELATDDSTLENLSQIDEHLNALQ